MVEGYSVVDGTSQIQLSVVYSVQSRYYLPTGQHSLYYVLLSSYFLCTL